MKSIFDPWLDSRIHSKPVGVEPVNTLLYMQDMYARVSMDTEPGGTASLDSGPVGAELTDTECKMESWAQAAVRVSPLPAHSTPRGARGVSGVGLSSPGDGEKGEDQQGRANTLFTCK